MKSQRAALALLLVLLLGSVASTCGWLDERPEEETSYQQQSAEGQTYDEQMEEVDEQINE